VENKELKRRLDKAIKALEFYADPLTYFATRVVCDPPAGDFNTDYNYCIDWNGQRTLRYGKTARKCLEKITKDDELRYNWEQTQPTDVNNKNG
jgi:hypothetical protein